MTKSARRKSRLPVQGSFYLKHRADCPAVAQTDGFMQRDLLSETLGQESTMGLQELEIAAGIHTDWRTAANQQIIWQIVHGSGLMSLGETQFAVVPGDVILIPDQQPYRLCNKSDVPLRLNQFTSAVRNPS